MESILKAINKAETLEIAKDIVNHVNDNQMACKSWLLEHIPAHNKALVLGGWYGYLANSLDGAVSIDMDPNCEKYGKIIYPDVKFVTEDAFEYVSRSPHYDMIVNTSCEHMNQVELSFMFAAKRKNSYVALQSNNYFEIEDHVNCKNSLEEFVAGYPFKEIHYQGVLEREKYTRWMVIGK